MAIKLQGCLRSKLVTFLSEIPILEEKDGPKSVLFNAELGKLFPKIPEKSTTQLYLGNNEDWASFMG